MVQITVHFLGAVFAACASSVPAWNDGFEGGSNVGGLIEAVLSPTGNFGNGTSSNTFSYADAKGNTYTRTVASVNSTITSDHEGGTLAQGTAHPASSPADVPQAGFARPRLPGRSAP